MNIQLYVGQQFIAVEQPCSLSVDGQSRELSEPTAFSRYEHQIQFWETLSNTRVGSVIFSEANLLADFPRLQPRPYALALMCSDLGRYEPGQPIHLLSVTPEPAVVQLLREGRVYREQALASVGLALENIGGLPAGGWEALLWSADGSRLLARGGIEVGPARPVPAREALGGVVYPTPPPGARVVRLPQGLVHWLEWREEPCEGYAFEEPPALAGPPLEWQDGVLCSPGALVLACRPGGEGHDPEALEGEFVGSYRSACAQDWRNGPLSPHNLLERGALLWPSVEREAPRAEATRPWLDRGSRSAGRGGPGSDFQRCQWVGPQGISLPSPCLVRAYALEGGRLGVTRLVV